MGDALTLQANRTGIGAWEPFWLGDPGRQLYASLHRSAIAGPRLGVLFAAPLFHEQPRSRRLLAEMASGFAAMGLPSLRFDFFGTGDSGGDSDQADFTSMCADLTLAAQALRAQAQVQRIVVFAWRAAALPVARWIGEGGDPDLVVLWEPIIDGASWLAELQRADAAERNSASRYRPDHAGAVPADERQLMGLAVSPRLLSDIAGARLSGHAPTHAPTQGARYWAVLRPVQSSPQQKPELALQRVFDLPVDSPDLGSGLRMDSGLFVGPSLKRTAEELAWALLEEG
ncbi:hypothetical protein ACFQZQ_01140 [Lysobacter koreensis]|uniref:Serine aminopeptidase S33 domain-containing protein n=1 Tax=Lysobacter koreensis TaxID=266122 RepID=A0ABW2YHF9_9GAMM